SDYISNGEWKFPPQLLHKFNFLDYLAKKVTIPMEASPDKLIWKHSDTGDLILKDAYKFQFPQLQDVLWAKTIWSSDIPPAKSLLVWRLMHEKVPTDENLTRRGCYIPSMCSLCNRHQETSFHLFFECPFAIKLWCWLASCLNMTLHFSSMDDIWKLCDRGWSPQCKITVTAALINLLNTIWFARNQTRFNSKQLPWRSAIAMIIANTSLTGNNTGKVSNNSIRDFTFLKQFKVNIHHPKAPVIKEIIWNPPLINWIKCNIDGASKGNPGISSCAGVFRN
ncbi:glycerol-3-phosphate dehydrogenase, partial [Trifolium medium]|nr:glycerol-3-phosphate dehydrogenase [Trifolium medium]